MVAPRWIDDDYIAQANREIFPIGQSETVKGVENIDEVIAAGGLAGIFIVPYDLLTSKGISNQLDHQNSR